MKEASQIAAIWQILGYFGAMSLACLVMWLLHRKGVDTVVVRARNEWQSLAEAQGKRIELMESRIKYLEDENSRTHEDVASKQRTIENMTQMNLNLQQKNMALEGEITTLKARVTELEREVTNFHAAPLAN